MRLIKGHDSGLNAKPMSVENRPQKPKNASVELESVHFSHDGKKEAISGISLKIDSGETVAFVGPSGGGKPTVSRLAVRFWDNPKGKITVGGMDISKIEPEKLMTLYSIIFQNITLFNNTIMANIRLSKKGAIDKGGWRRHTLQIAMSLPKNCLTNGTQILAKKQRSAFMSKSNWRRARLISRSHLSINVLLLFIWKSMIFLKA